MVVVVTVTAPTGSAHATSKSTSVLPSAGTVAVRGLSPVRMQPSGTPDSAMAWSPAGSPATVMPPFTPMVRASPPSTLTVYPSSPVGGASVTVRTTRSPVAGAARSSPLQDTQSNETAQVVTARAEKQQKVCGDRMRPTLRNCC